MLGMNKSMMLVCKKAFQYILKWLRTANHLKISEVLIQLGLITLIIIEWFDLKNPKTKGFRSVLDQYI